VYDEPTVLVAKRVTGEEEVPEGAVAVLTPDAPGVLSRVSVRARNMKVLFAVCHEEGPLKEVEDKQGTTISLQVRHHPLSPVVPYCLVKHALNLMPWTVLYHSHSHAMHSLVPAQFHIMHSFIACLMGLPLYHQQVLHHPHSPGLSYCIAKHL